MKTVDVVDVELLDVGLESVSVIIDVFCDVVAIGTTRVGATTLAADMVS